MSTARDGFWRRLLLSLWLLFPVVGFGILGAAALITVGATMGRRSAWISGIGYLVVSVPVFVVVGETEEGTALSDWSVGALMAIWLVTIIHSFLVNADWLRSRAAGSTPWPDLPAPAAQLAPPPGYPAPGAKIDVNAADLEQLMTLPYFDHARALRAVADRERHGPFDDIIDFGRRMALQPHEQFRVYPVIVAYQVAPTPPPPPAPATPPPGPPGPAGHPGRIVDV